jgi:hypothetical protein
VEPAKRNRAARLAAYLEEAQPTLIDEAERDRIVALLAPVSEKRLRTLLLNCGRPLAPLVEGVRQDCFDSLARTLLTLAGEYRAGTTEQRNACRAAVIRAKDHARFSARRNESVRQQKDQMILWMLTWLENPDIFPVWLEIRRKLRDNREDEPTNTSG